MVSKRKHLKRILITIIAVIFILFATFFTTKAVYDSVFVRYETTAAAPLNIGSVKQYNSGSNQLSATLYESSTPNDKSTLIVIIPGMNACQEDYALQIDALLSYGWAVFIFDATGSGDSEGHSAVGFSQIVLDTESTLNFIENNGRFGYNSIVLLGHSRGGYAAASLINRAGISAVVSVSGVNSAMEGVMGSASSYVGALAFCNYGPLWLYQAGLFGTDVLSLNAQREISNSNVPALIVHGQNDEQVPADKYSIYSYKDKIKNKNARFLLCGVYGSDGHKSLLFNGENSVNAELFSNINSFLLENI